MPGLRQSGDVVDLDCPLRDGLSAVPSRATYQRWGAAIAIERRPSVAARLHDTGRELAPGVRLSSPVTIETRCIADWGIWVDGSGVVKGADTEGAGRHLL